MLCRDDLEGRYSSDAHSHHRAVGDGLHRATRSGAVGGGVDGDWSQGQPPSTAALLGEGSTSAHREPAEAEADGWALEKVYSEFL